MTKLHKIPITFTIELEHNEYNNSGWPMCQIDWNGRCVQSFEANVNNVSFTISQDPTLEVNVLRFHHYGINHHRDNKWVEVKRLWVNGVDLESITWEATQFAFIPPWDDQDNVMQGNLYLGYNGYIEWKFGNPILSDIQDRLNKGVKQIDKQETTREVLDQMKNLFFTESQDNDTHSTTLSFQEKS